MNIVSSLNPDVNQMYLYAINSSDIRDEIKVVMYSIFPAFFNVGEEQITEDTYEYLLEFINEIKKGYEKETGDTVVLTSDDEVDLARQLSRHFSESYINDIKNYEQAHNIEEAFSIPSAPVFPSKTNFKDEIVYLRRYLGSVRVMQHPVISDATMIYNKRIGTLDKFTFFRILNELRRVHPDYRMTNMWKNDAVYTGADDKRPNWIGAEFTLELDDVIKRLDLNTISLSVTMTIEKK